MKHELILFDELNKKLKNDGLPRSTQTKHHVNKGSILMKEILWLGSTAWGTRLLAHSISTPKKFVQHQIFFYVRKPKALHAEFASV